MKTIKVYLQESINIKKFQALCFKTAEIADAELRWQAPLLPKDRRGTYGSKRSAIFKKDGNVSVVEFDHSYVEEATRLPFDQYMYHEIMVHGPNMANDPDPFIMDSLCKAIEQFKLSIDGTREDTEMFGTRFEITSEQPFSIEDEDDRKFSNFVAYTAVKYRSDSDDACDGYIIVLEKGYSPLEQCGIVCTIEDTNGKNVLNSETTPYPWLLKDKAFLKRCLTAAIRNAESWKSCFPNDGCFRAYGSMYWLGLGGWNNNPYHRADYKYKVLTVKDVPAKPRQVSKKKMKKGGR